MTIKMKSFQNPYKKGGSNLMTDKKLWKIIDNEFISYYGGHAYLISNGDCKFHVWEHKEDAQKVCDMLNELSLPKIRYSALKEAHFTKMGGFTMERDGRGRYNICSENVIPKNNAVIRIAAPDVIWNSLVAEIFESILTEED